jgi:thiaminase/transcriptional activator TenA
VTIDANQTGATMTTTEPDAPARTGWTGRLWVEIEDTFAAILDHPFIHGLTSGDLAADAFFYFISQDAHYVREYMKALALLAAKAPSVEATALLTRHAANVISAESTLHEALVTDLGGDPAALALVRAQPTTQAYTSYLLATIYGGDFAEGLAAVMPCYWIYAEVGRHLHRQGSPNPVYQRWIDNYGGDEYRDEVAAALELTDKVGSDLTGGQEARARRHFATTARYEWMFWDAAWRREPWPI